MLSLSPGSHREECSVRILTHLSRPVGICGEEYAREWDLPLCLWPPRAPSVFPAYTHPPPPVTYSHWILLTCIFLLHLPQVRKFSDPLYPWKHLSFLYFGLLVLQTQCSDRLRKTMNLQYVHLFFVAKVCVTPSPALYTIQSRNPKYGNWNFKSIPGDFNVHPRLKDHCFLGVSFEGS